MEIYIYLWLLFVVGVFLYGVSVIIKYSRKRKLSFEQKKQFTKHLVMIWKKVTYKEQIISYDILYHKILLGLSYIWTFGEILKQEPNEIGDIEKVWKLHKLRNKLVHELDHHTEPELQKEATAFKKELRSLLKVIWN